MNFRATPNRWLTTFAVLTAGFTFCLVWIGGLVTSHEAGMSVPDWPTSYGYNMFRFPYPKWIGGVFYEHSHRLVASGVGLLTAILALWLWGRETSGKEKRNGILAITAILLIVGGMMGVRKTPVFVSIAVAGFFGIVFGIVQIRKTTGLRWFGIVALSAVVMQGVLGGLRVTQMKDEIGIFHATIAQLFFLFLAAIALFTTSFWNDLPAGCVAIDRPAKKIRNFCIITTALILCQLILGAAMRHQHAGLAIPDFPLAYGKVWPDLDAQSVAHYNQAREEVAGVYPITASQIVLQMVHRLMALTIAVHVLVVAIRSLKTLGWENRLTRGAWIWLLLIIIQFSLGVATVLTGKSADIATAHVAFGALSLVCGGLLAILSFRLLPASAAQKEFSKKEMTTLPGSSTIAR